MLVHRQFGDGLGKHHVRAGFNAGSGTLQRRLQPFNGQRIGTRHDHEAVVSPGIHGSLDPVDHFLLRNDFLVGTVPTTLGADLILDVNRRRPGLDHRAHGPRHVESRRTETGIDVHQQRQIADVGDAPHIDQHVFKASDSQVRNAQ